MGPARLLGHPLAVGSAVGQRAAGLLLLIVPVVSTCRAHKARRGSEQPKIFARSSRAALSLGARYAASCSAVSDGGGAAGGETTETAKPFITHASSAHEAACSKAGWMGSGASGRLAARRSRLRPTLAAAAGRLSQIRCTQAGSSLWPQHVCTARRRAVGTACVPCSASIERVEIEQVGERDRSVAADPDGQREGVLGGEDWQRDEFLLRARTHAHSVGQEPIPASDGPGCTSTWWSAVASLVTVAGGGGGGGSSASSASVGVGGGNGCNLTPAGDPVSATFSLCRESGERIGVACRACREAVVRNGTCGHGQRRRRERGGTAAAQRAQNARHSPFESRRGANAGNLHRRAGKTRATPGTPKRQRRILVRK